MKSVFAGFATFFAMFIDAATAHDGETTAGCSKFEFRKFAASGLP